MVLTTWTLPNVLVHKTINPQRWFTVHNTYSVFVCSYKDIMVLIDKFSDKITQHPQLDSEKLVRALEQAAVNACSMWCSTNCQGAWQMLGKTLFFRKKSDVAAFVLHYDSILDSVEVEINYV